MRLSGVVGGPVLLVGRLDRLGQDRRFSRRRGRRAIGAIIVAVVVVRLMVYSTA
jgi:hypothetical protein